MPKWLGYLEGHLNFGKSGTRNPKSGFRFFYLLDIYQLEARDSNIALSGDPASFAGSIALPRSAQERAPSESTR